MRQVDGLLLQVIEQTARCRHQNVDAAFQLVDLRIDVDSTYHRHRIQLQVFAVLAHAFFNLGRQFARRDQHQRADRALADSRLLAGGEQLQNGQRKTGSLAGAGLRAGQQIAA
jgi:hypothetical protein